MASVKDKFLKIVVIDEEESDDGLETAEEKKQRWLSIRIIYYTMFIISLGFSIILTAVWPFLDKLDPNAGKEFMGYIVAANPLGQMIFSPLVGWWANKSGSIRIPMLTTLTLFVFSSSMYSMLEVFDANQKYWMLFSRFLVGVSSANIAAVRSYLSAATRLSERTRAVSIVSLAQVLGFVVGPVLQAAVTVLGEDGYRIVGDLRLNMFTATGWLNAIFGLINFVLFLPFIFHEHKIAAKEAMVYQGKASEKEAWKSIKPDYLACWTLILSFFFIVFSFVLPETLATSLTMDQFAWSKTESLRYMGMLMGGGAVVSITIFVGIKHLTKIFQERTLMLWGGFLMVTVATAFLLPWKSEPPALALPANYSLDDLKLLIAAPEYANYTLEGLAVHLSNGTELLGCPVTRQPWCDTIPGLYVSQFLMAYMFASIGYPLGVTLIQTIFSKVLGPRPQGVWMGLLTGSGCLSRIMGPVYVSYVYSKLGPIYTFSTTIAMLVLCMIFIRIVNKRLIPPDLGGEPMNGNGKCNGNKNIEMKEYRFDTKNGNAQNGNGTEKISNGSAE